MSPSNFTTKVLIVDDSIMFRQALKTFFAKDPEIIVVGTAANTTEALEKMKSLAPDVVTMDVEMPKEDGITFLRKTMGTHPIPVIIVSSTPTRVLDALSAGAVDFVRKSTANTPHDFQAFAKELIGKVKIAKHAKTGKNVPAPLTSISQAPIISPLLPHRNFIISIGASTGGTEAILEVIKHLPASTPGIVITQHMPPVFTNMYAQRLHRECTMSVKEAQNGDRIQKGHILLAPGDQQMTVHKDAQGYFVRWAKGEKVSGHCPSVDVLFSSVAQVAKHQSIGVILTGMGSDGAKGLLDIKRCGGYTIGQDKESSIVYGMPKVAFENGAVKKQLPLLKIKEELIRLIHSGLN